MAVLTWHHSDWLNVHEIQHQEFQFILNLCSRASLLASVESTNQSGDVQTDLCLEDAIDEIIAPSIGSITGRPEEIREFLKSRVKFIVSSTPSVVPDTKSGTVKVFVPWAGKPSDFLYLAHEVAHTVQYCFSGGKFVPPAIRETCAFLAELALVRHFVGQPNFRHALLAEWYEQNLFYLGSDLRFSLKQSLQSPYSYRQNYPVARILSLFLSPYLGLSEMNRLFEGEISVGQLLPSLKLREKTLMRPKVNLDHDLSGSPEGIWHTVEHIFQAWYPSSHTKIARRSHKSVVNISEFEKHSKPLAGEILGNKFARIPLTSGKARTAHLIYAFGHCLSKGRMPPNCATGSDLGLVAQLNEYFIESEQIPEARLNVGKSLGLSETALFDAFTKGICKTWYEELSEVLCIFDESDGFNIVNENLIKWRSLGVQALCLMNSESCQLTFRETLERHSPETNLNPSWAWSASYPDMLSNGFDRLCALGMAVKLLSDSDYHQNQRLSAYLPVEIIPPILLDQFRIFTDASCNPEGFVTWAWLNPETQQKVLRSGRSLRFDEWKDGPCLFCNDWLTNSDKLTNMVSHMRRVVFPNHTATSIRRSSTGDIRKVNKWNNRPRARFP